MRETVADQQPDFSGGLNSVASAVAVGPNQFSVGTNVRLTQFGAATKRGGTQRITSAPIDAQGIQGIVEWALSDGTRYVLSTADGGLYRSVYGTLPMTFTQVTGSLSTSTYSDFVAFRDSTGDALYVADGGGLNKLTVAAGPTFTLTTDIASTPSVTSVDVFNQRLWACGSPTSPQSIFYSDENNGDTLGVGASGGGQIIVRTFGQQNVVAVQALGTSLLIFHRGGVSRLTGYGEDDIVAVPAGVTGEVGTTAAASVARVGNVIFYVNVRGLFVASPEGVVQVSTPDKPDPLSIVLPTLTETQLSNVTSVFYRATRELLINVPTVGCYVYHTVLQSWSGPWVGTFLNSARQPMAEVGTSDNVPIVLKGGPDGYIERLDSPSTTTDSALADATPGSVVQMTLQCRRQFSGDFAGAKSYRWGYVLADLGGSEDSTLEWQTDLSGGQRPLSQTALTVLGTEGGDTFETESGDIVSVTTSVQSLKVPVWGTGYYIDLTLRDNSTVAIPTFSRVETTAYALGRR